MWRLREAPRQKLGKAPNPPEEAVFASSSASWKESARAASRSDYFGSSVIAPVLLYSVEPEYTNAAIKANIEGICVVSLVVDAEGVPQNVRVLKGLGSGLDKNALEAVKDYRYLPAMRDGEPVPAVITVEVKFALEESPPN
jgi:TonB family protein